MGMGGQRHAPTALPPGKTLYPLYRRLGEVQGPSLKAILIAQSTQSAAAAAAANKHDTTNGTAEFILSLTKYFAKTYGGAVD